jgi:hypothetical protein
MWMVDPKILCLHHLLGEHLECHMFAGCLNKGKKVDGYIKNGILETKSIKSRHDELASEMIGRGYRHNTPLKDGDYGDFGHVCREKSLKELLSRCKVCSNNLKGESSVW